MANINCLRLAKHRKSFLQFIKCVSGHYNLPTNIYNHIISYIEPNISVSQLFDRRQQFDAFRATISMLELRIRSQILPIDVIRQIKSYIWLNPIESTFEIIRLMIEHTKQGYEYSMPIKIMILNAATSKLTRIKSIKIQNSEMIIAGDLCVYRVEINQKIIERISNKIKYFAFNCHIPLEDNGLPQFYIVYRLESGDVAAYSDFLKSPGTFSRKIKCIRKNGIEMGLTVILFE